MQNIQQTGESQFPISCTVVRHGNPFLEAQVRVCCGNCRTKILTGICPKQDGRVGFEAECDKRNMSNLWQHKMRAGIN